MCETCGGIGQLAFTDPVTERPAAMLCPTCTPEGVDLAPLVEEEAETFELFETKGTGWCAPSP